MDSSTSPSLLNQTVAFCRFATVVPVYRPSLTEIELRRLALTLKNSPNGHVFLVGPKTLDGTFESPILRDLPFVGFPDFNFKSVKSYNSWMLQPDLYRTFDQFEFVLICQTDALLVRPLPHDDAWAFDYVGAPWRPRYRLRWARRQRRLKRSRFGWSSNTVAVGNGGLSLRRTSVFSKCLDFPEFDKVPNEDIAISYFHARIGVTLASEQTAERLFMETGAADWHEGQPIPDVYGFHGLERINPRLEQSVLTLVD